VFHHIQQWFLKMKKNYNFFKAPTMANLGHTKKPNNWISCGYMANCRTTIGDGFVQTTKFVAMFNKGL
jgi:hypothetical protein